MRNRLDTVKDLEVISKLEPEDNINHASERDSILLDALLKRHLQENRYELEEVKKDIDSILFGVRASIYFTCNSFKFMRCTQNIVFKIYYLVVRNLYYFRII